MEVRYVVVVHGMGVAKPNETVLGVVSRFADQRQRAGGPWPPPQDITTLGAATSQVGRGAVPWELPSELPWLEFAGIPRVAPENGATPRELFLGQRADPPDGTNIRFVDIHWKDLMQEDFPSVGQDPDVWLDGLLGRLRRKHFAAARNACDSAESAFQSLHEISPEKFVSPDIRANLKEASSLQDQSARDMKSGMTTDAAMNARKAVLKADAALGSANLKDQAGNFDAEAKSCLAASGKGVPKWAMEILGALRESIRLFHGVMAIKASAIDKTIFNDYLGDVQLYGEYSHTRGRAVRRFHELMTYILRKHDDEERKRIDPSGQFCPMPRKAAFTVIAHSLGTVMSMDSLLYAHADPAILRGGANGVSNLPLGGYLNKEELQLLAKYPPATLPNAIAAADQADYARLKEITDARWALNVDSFVTLGSPIDKFLVIWWLNYRHLAGIGWMDPSRTRGSGSILGKIRHFNYSEAQDPVGDNLDVARTAPAFDAIFENIEDKIQTRYAIPGLAHVQYWHDQPLFDRIIARTIDGDLNPPSIEWFSRPVYVQIMIITYWTIPAAAIAASSLAFLFAYHAERWYGAFIPSLMLFAVWMLGRYLNELTIWWRQIMRCKDPVEASSKPSMGKFIGEVPLELRGKLIVDPSNNTLHSRNLDPEEDRRNIENIQDPRLQAAVRALADKSSDLRKKSQAGRARDLLNFFLEYLPFTSRGDTTTDEGNQAFQNSQESWFRGSISFYVFLFWLVAGLSGGRYLLENARRENVWPLNIGRLAQIFVVFALCWMAWHLLYRSNNVRANTEAQPTDDFYGKRDGEWLATWDDFLPLLLLLIAYPLGRCFLQIVPHLLKTGIAHARLASAGDEARWMAWIDSILNFARRWHPSPQLTFSIAVIASVSMLVMGYVSARLRRIRRMLRTDRWKPINFVDYSK